MALRPRDHNKLPGSALGQWTLLFYFLSLNTSGVMNVYTSEGIKLRSIESQLAEQQKLTWGLLVLGVAVGFVGMHFVVARPLTREMEQMKRDLVQVEGRLQELTGATDQAWEANSLLSSLKAQRSQLEDARGSLQAIAELRQELINEGRATAAATQTLSNIADLQRQIVDQRSDTEVAAMTYEQMVALENRLISQQSTHQDAVVAANQLIDLKAATLKQSKDLPVAIAAVEQNGKLQQQILAQQEATQTAAKGLTQAQEVARQASTLIAGLQADAPALEAANQGLRSLIALRESLLDGAQFVELAQAVAGQLLDMQQQIADRATGVEIAQGQVQKLISLNDTARDDVVDLELAQRNLGSLLKVEGILTAQTTEVADAIQALELLTEFQEEFSTQIQLLGEMRRSLIELGMMESSVAKAVKMLEPLIDLGNVRRLNDDDLRNVAKTILERRSARVADVAEEVPNAGIATPETTVTVPQPQD